MHVTQPLLDAVDRGELSREFLLEILIEHLAATCPDCTEGIAAHHQAGFGAAGVGSPGEHGDPAARLGRRLGWGERQLRAEERIARAWVREILKLDPSQRRGRIHGAYSRFRGSLFGVLLLEEARRRIPADPAEALSLAEAVLVSCQRTRPHQPDPEVQAAALAVRGNAKRALGRLLDAEADLEEGRRLLDAPGVRDPTLPAEVDSYLGSLRKDQGRLDEAARHLRRAGAIYGLLRQPEKAARVQLKLGLVHFHRHEHEAAVRAAEEAVRLLDGSSDLRLHAYAHYDLALFLHAVGAVEEAEAELASHEELFAAGGDYVAQHLVWLRARIAWGRGDLRSAERLFTEARERAIERGIAFDTSLVSLELALVHLAQGRTGKVKRLAAEALAVFAEQEVERETRAALALAEEAARREALTRELLEQAIAAVERARIPGR